MIPRWEDCRAGRKLSLAGGAIGVLVVKLRFGVYHVIVNGVPAEECYETLDVAEEAGVAFARKIMQHAVRELDLLRMMEGES